jgi:hypothetical protein
MATLLLAPLTAAAAAAILGRTAPTRKRAFHLAALTSLIGGPLLGLLAGAAIDVHFRGVYNIVPASVCVTAASVPVSGLLGLVAGWLAGRGKPLGGQAGR